MAFSVARTIRNFTSLVLIMLLLEQLSLPLASAAVVLCLSYLVLGYWKRNFGLPPGPWGLPFFGYYPFLSIKPHIDLARLAKKYGNVFCFRTIGGKLFVVISGAKLIKEVFVGRAEEFIGRPKEITSMEWISNGLGIAQEEGSPWKEHRRFFLQTAKSFGFGKTAIEEKIQEEIKTLLDDLKETNAKPVHFAFHVSYVINSVISHVLFLRKFKKDGTVFAELSKGVHDLIDTFTDNRLMLVGSFFKYIVMKLFPSSEKLHRGRHLLKKTVDAIVDEHIKTFDPNYLRDYVDCYLNQMEILKKSGDVDASSFTMDRLRAIAMNMLMEGSGSLTICRLLLELSKHPNEQKLAQMELDAVVGRERLPSWMERQKMPYVESLILELFRTAMSFYITSHYSNFEETKIQGYRIPRRSIVIANLWTINNDPEIYPEPSKFDPNRFLGKDGKRIKTEGPYPFGIGKRSCVGEALGQMEVFLIISAILQNFTIYPGDSIHTLRAVPRSS
ncbi:Cytochrome P450 2C20, partial [Stegodyphus mimosarum]